MDLLIADPFGVTGTILDLVNFEGNTDRTKLFLSQILSH